MVAAIVITSPTGARASRIITDMAAVIMRKGEAVSPAAAGVAAAGVAAVWAAEVTD